MKAFSSALNCAKGQEEEGRLDPNVKAGCCFALHYNTMCANAHKVDQARLRTYVRLAT